MYLRDALELSSWSGAVVVRLGFRSLNVIGPGWKTRRQYNCPYRPLPKIANSEESNNIEIETDIEKLLQKNSGEKKTDTTENSSTSLEESIIKKIK